MELRDYYRIIKRRKIYILTILIIISSIYILSIYRKPIIYRATATILLQPPSFEEQILGVSLGNVARIARIIDMETQLRIMLSKPLAQKVVDRINKETKLKVTLDEVLASRTISQSPQALIINIDATSKEKEKAILIANTYAKISVEENRRLSQREYINAVKYLNKKISTYNNRLLETEKKIKNFNRKYGVIDFSQNLDTLAARLSDLKIQKEQIKMQKDESQRLIGQITAELKSHHKFIEVKEIIPDPLIQTYKAQLLPLEMDLLHLQHRYTDEHPKVIAAKQRIKELKEKTDKEIAKYIEVPSQQVNPEYQFLTSLLHTHRMNLITLSIREKAIDKIIKTEHSQLMNLSDEELEYIKLIEEKETSKRLTTTLQNTLENLQLQDIIKSGNAQVVDLALTATPLTRTQPHQLLFVLLVSLVVSIATAVVIEYLDDRVRTPMHVKRYLNLPTIGSIPRIEAPELRLLIGLHEKAPLAEIFHKTSFILQSMCLKQKMKSLAITSAKTEEGKTTVVVNLGISLARIGEKVALVDADFRRPALHRMFALSNMSGLTSILSGEIFAEEKLLRMEEMKKFGKKMPTFEEIVLSLLKDTEIEGLKVLPAGPSVVNPVGVLKKDEMKKVIEVLENNFSLILFDSPPLLTVIDPSVLATNTDATILVIDASLTKRREVREAKKVLTDIGLPVLGVILNNLIPAEIEEYYSYSYSYKYGKYYKRRKI